VHNDFKFDNAIVAEDDPTRFVAILDWDMSTLGDPLVDLGNVLALWREASDPKPWYAGAMPTTALGFPSRADLVRRYAARTGRDVAAIGWYHAFSLFRYAGIAQQIYARFVRGQTGDERFASFGERAQGLIHNGLDLTSRL
jgi:aminoglycoside phosphotransferase (APT) family kinase protein